MTRRRLQSPEQDFPSKIHIQHTHAKRHVVDDDEGSTTGKQKLLGLSALLERPKRDEKETEDFRKTIGEERREMKELIQQRRAKIEGEDSRRRKEISSLIAKALRAPESFTEGETATFPHTKIASNPTLASAKKVNTACQRLLSEYNSLEATLAGMAEDVNNTATERWARDVEETERRLRLGHKIAVRNVKRMLDGKVKENDMDEEEAASGFVQKELNMALHKSLGYAERGVKRMVKGLPQDAD